MLPIPGWQGVASRDRLQQCEIFFYRIPWLCVPGEHCHNFFWRHSESYLCPGKAFPYILTCMLTTSLSHSTSLISIFHPSYVILVSSRARQTSNNNSASGGPITLNISDPKTYDYHASGMYDASLKHSMTDWLTHSLTDCRRAWAWSCVSCLSQSPH